MARQPPPTAPRRLPLSGSDLLLLLILGLGSSRIVIPILAPALGLGELGAHARIGAVLLLLAVQTSLLLLVIYLIAVRWRGVTWGELGFVPVPPGWAGRAVAIAVLSFPVVGAVNWLQQWITDQPFENPQLQAMAPPEFSWMAYLGTLAVAAVLAPIAEETAFRGLFYRWLHERYGYLPAVGGSALAFSILHGIPALIPAIMVLGAILAWTYERSRSIWVPVIVHAMYNGVVTTFLYAALAQGLEPGGF